MDFDSKKVIKEIRDRIVQLPDDQLADVIELVEAIKGVKKLTSNEYERGVIAGTIQEILFPEWLLLLGQKGLQSKKQDV